MSTREQQDAEFRKQLDTRLVFAERDLRKALKASLPDASSAKIEELIVAAKVFADSRDRAWGDYNAEMAMLYEEEL